MPANPLRHLILLALSLALLQAADEAPALRMYDLTDLLVTKLDAPVRTLGVTTVPAKDGTIAAPPATDPAAGEALVRRHFMAPLVDAILERGTFRGTTWILNATPTMHAHVEGVLQRVRRSGMRQVAIDIQSFEMDPTHRRRTYALPDLPWQQHGAGCASVALGPSACQELLTRLTQDPVLTHMTMPRITTLADQPASIAIGKQQEWCHPGHHPRNGDLQTDLIMTGTSCNVRAVPSDDGLLMALTVDAQYADVVSSLSVPDPQGRDAPWTMPLVHHRRDTAQMVLSAGQTLVIKSTLAVSADQKVTNGFLFVTPTLVEMPQAHGAPAPADAPAAPGVKNGAAGF